VPWMFTTMLSPGVNSTGAGTRSNRACGFPAHGLPVVVQMTALRGLPEGRFRVLDGPARA
jgi:hypothetical protein